MSPQYFSGSLATYVAPMPRKGAFGWPSVSRIRSGWTAGWIVGFSEFFVLITALMFPLELILDLGDGIQELWLLGVLFAVGLLKVAQDLVRRNRKPGLEEHGPLLVVGTAEPPAPAAASIARRPSSSPQTAQPMARAQVEPPLREPSARQRAEPIRWQPTADPFSDTSETIRIDTGDDGRVQFLPGRLEVVGGAEVGREFHFLRLPGQPVPEITIGRAHGPAHRHVQIPAPTVSRMHAMLRFQDRRWRLLNLSATNPVRVNGVELGTPDEAVLLSDGDSIVLGEVELCYRDTRA
jgi:hypothetical protein